MTKGERRKARKVTTAQGLPYREHTDCWMRPDCDTGLVSFSPEHTKAGQCGRERWARWQDECNGAPTDPEDY